MFFEEVRVRAERERAVQMKRARLKSRAEVARKETSSE
jgi:hypothetical protein